MTIIWQHENWYVFMYVLIDLPIFVRTNMTYDLKNFTRQIYCESKTKIETVHLRTTTSTTILHGTIGRIIHDKIIWVEIIIMFYSSLYLIEKVWICCFIEYEISIRNSIFILFYFICSMYIILLFFLSFSLSLLVLHYN